MPSDNALEVSRSLGRIEGQLAEIHEDLQAAAALAEKRHADRNAEMIRYDGRVRSLEKFRAWTLGIGAAVTALTGFVATLATVGVKFSIACISTAVRAIFPHL